ncbi:histidine phosphatase family protein [Candidatus Woesearchaeota archaeon]|jgi:2,3-bisphosphoglycerate-dependent phosphoglycerate mutase|nr:histidine phosphatase family protein [Candidatus Woesearchaeota archaeon]MBT5739851.1 histidine phosphatase family protein [Candidatus Woesearchaeota archaeon]
MVKRKIYLFRHGLTYYNKHQWFTGQIDSHMTEEGCANAEKIAKKLKHKKIDIGYHSGLIRSEETLKVVLNYHPECKETILDKRIIERNYGKLQRRSHKEFQQEIGNDIASCVEGKYGKLPRLVRDDFSRAVAKTVYNLYHRSYDIPPPGGESVKDVEKRVHRFIKDLLKRMKCEKINVAISAHGNSMRPFRRHFEKLTVKEMLDLENPWGEIYVYTIEV